MTAPLTSAEAERRIAEIARGLTKAQREAILSPSVVDIAMRALADKWRVMGDDLPLTDDQWLRISPWEAEALEIYVRTSIEAAIDAITLTQESNR